MSFFLETKITFSWFDVCVLGTCYLEKKVYSCDNKWFIIVQNLVRHLQQLMTGGASLQKGCFLASHFRIQAHDTVLKIYFIEFFGCCSLLYLKWKCNMLFSSFSWIELIVSDSKIALVYSIAPAVLRQATYGTIKIGIYYSLKKVFIKHPEGNFFYYLCFIILYYY